MKEFFKSLVWTKAQPNLTWLVVELQWETGEKPPSLEDVQRVANERLVEFWEKHSGW